MNEAAESVATCEARVAPAQDAGTRLEALLSDIRRMIRMTAVMLHRTRECLSETQLLLKR